MAIIWFITTIVFLVLYLQKDSKKSPLGDGNYQQGYWDGYRAFGEKVQKLLNRGGDVTDDLRRYVAEGNGEAYTGADNDLLTDVPSSAAEVSSQLTPEEAAAEKQQTALRNLNTLLYFASFLLVAAAAAFIAASMPEMVRLVGLIIVAVLFYAAGIVLYKTIKRLRPAAIAFTGTGLAIVPFVGVALHMLGGMPSSVSWLTVSIVGVILYYVAAIVLKSQVVSYLTMAFVLSLVSAGVSTAALPIIWYFIVLIAVSLGASSLAILAPRWVPTIFREPVERTGQVVTPFVLIASLMMPDRLDVHAYEIVFGIATAHYLVAWLQRHDFTYETAARVLGQLTLGIVAWDIGGGRTTLFGMMLVAVATLQTLYSLARVRPSSQFSRKAETIWLIAMLAGMQLVQPVWFGAAHAGVWSSITLAATGSIAGLALFRLRDARWGYAGLAASVFLLPVLGRKVVEPALDWGAIAFVFALAAGAMLLFLRSRWPRWRQGRAALLAVIASVIYMIMLAFAGILSGDAVTMGWSFAAVAAGLVALSYIADSAYVEAVAAIPFVAAVASFIHQSSLPDEWYWASVFLVSSALLVAAVVVHRQLGDRLRRNVVFYAALIVFGCLIFAEIDATHVVRETLLGLFIAGSLGLVGMRAALRTRSTLCTAVAAAYLSYAFIAWLISLLLGPLPAALAYGLLIIVFWLTSYFEKVPWAMALGNVAVAAATYCLWDGLHLPSQWMVFGVGWITTVVIYGVYWLLVERRDTSRQGVQIASAWAALAVTIVLTIASLDTAHQIAWAITVLAGATTVGIYGYTSKRDEAIEAAIYILTFGLQRLVATVVMVDSLVFYGYWWAVVIALVAWWRGAGRGRTVRFAVAASLITASVGGYALYEGGWYQLFFLVQSLAMLVVGALVGLRWLLWWGLIAASLAVLYFLRDYTYLGLGFLGLLLISIVVWRLLKHRDV